MSTPKKPSELAQELIEAVETIRDARERALDLESRLGAALGAGQWIVGTHLLTIKQAQSCTRWIVSVTVVEAIDDKIRRKGGGA